MNWANAGEFFAMGGYALYVWGAYGLTAALIGIESWRALRRRRRALQAALAAIAEREAEASRGGRP